MFTRVVAEKRCVEHQFVRGAYFEFFMPKHCGKCKSTGTVAAKNCPQCCGSGLGRYSDEQRAKLISVDRNNPHTRKYYKKRENVYQELIEYFNHLERTVVNNVYSKLIEPEEKSIISSVDY